MSAPVRAARVAVAWLLVQPSLEPSLVPRPAPLVPPGKLAGAADTILGWMQWGGLAGAVGALIAAGIMMIVGRRNRHSMAVDGALSVPWVIGGLALMFGATALVGFLAES
jgi:hypothetical protein